MMAGSVSVCYYIYVFAHLLVFMGSISSTLSSTMIFSNTLAARVGGSPASAPAPGPARLPVRTLVAVQGVVYCKPCKYQGVRTLLGASPLPGAVVRLECNNTGRNPVREETKTDKNGYFLLQASKNITNYGAHKCKMLLVSSPLKTCNKPTDLHMGSSGSYLIREQKQPPSLSTSPIPYTLYSTFGPFAFDPTSCPGAN